MLQPMMRIEGFIEMYCIGQKPIIFQYAGTQVYYINRILEIWIVQTNWWASEAHCTYYRISAKGKIYTLSYNSPTQRHWFLLGMQN